MRTDVASSIDAIIARNAGSDDGLIVDGLAVDGLALEAVLADPATTSLAAP